MVTGLLLNLLGRLRSVIVFVDGWEVRRADAYVEKCVDVDGKAICRIILICLFFLNIYQVDYLLHVVR